MVKVPTSAAPSKSGAPNLADYANKASSRHFGAQDPGFSGGIDPASRELRQIWDFRNPDQLIDAATFGTYQAKHKQLRDTSVPQTLEAYKMAGEMIKADSKLYQAWHKDVRMPSLANNAEFQTLDTEAAAQMVTNEVQAAGNLHNLGQLQRSAEAAASAFQSQLSARSMV